MMSSVAYREAGFSDIPSIARILSDSETETHWNQRVTAYFNREHHPQKALLPRVIYVAIAEEIIVGVIAGHLTQRFSCQAELQWINVIPQYRKSGLALELLRLLAGWFVEQRAFSVCVDVGSESGRKFYTKTGAKDLNPHWMVWRNISTLLRH